MSVQGEGVDTDPSVDNKTISSVLVTCPVTRSGKRSLSDQWRVQTVRESLSNFQIT